MEGLEAAVEAVVLEVVAVTVLPHFLRQGCRRTLKVGHPRVRPLVEGRPMEGRLVEALLDPLAHLVSLERLVLQG